MALESLKHWLRLNRHELVQATRLLRYEAESTWADLRGRYSSEGRRRLRRLKGERGLRLHIASGPMRREGWINVDSIAGADLRLDLRRPFPLGSGSVRLIFSEHFFDHLPYPDVARRVAAEWYRLLEPGGRIRLVMHDGELLARKYLERDQAFFAAATGLTASIVAVNHLFRFNGFHNFIYDFDSLSALLRGVGFAEVIRSSFRGSAVAELNLDHDGPDRAVQSLYAEALKS